MPTRGEAAYVQSAISPLNAKSGMKIGKRENKKLKG
jgi:hypothetical protein